MKYLCDICERLVDAGAFKMEGADLLLSCPKCTGESRVLGGAALAPQAQASQPAIQSGEGRPVVVPFAPRPSPVALVPEPPEAEPAMPVPASERCPKCATPKNGRAACVKCGLVFDLYKPEQDVIPQSARRDFAKLLEAQGSPEAEKILNGVPPGAVVILARLCRHHLADFPDDPRALAMLEQLTARSMALASAAAQSESLNRQSPADARKKIVTFALVAALVGLLALLSMLVRSG